MPDLPLPFVSFSPLPPLPRDPCNYPLTLAALHYPQYLPPAIGMRIPSDGLSKKGPLESQLNTHFLPSNLPSQAWISPYSQPPSLLVPPRLLLLELRGLGTPLHPPFLVRPSPAVPCSMLKRDNPIPIFVEPASLSSLPPPISYPPPPFCSSKPFHVVCAGVSFFFASPLGRRDPSPAPVPHPPSPFTCIGPVAPQD